MTTAIDLDAMLRRLHLPTVRRLYTELEIRAETEKQSYREYLTLLIAEEVAHRGQTRIQRAVRRARFPFLKTIEEFNWTFQTSIDPKLLGSYLGPELVSEGRGLIFSGPTGTGKTSLSIAIAYRAIQNGFDALFTTANELIHDLSVASRDGRLTEALHPYTHVPVLVIDEVGYLVHPPDAANVLFQVVNERNLKHRPMIFTTNKPIDAWGQVLHDPDLQRRSWIALWSEAASSSYAARPSERVISPAKSRPSHKGTGHCSRVPFKGGLALGGGGNRPFQIGQ
jgi:DNA replication protein DnaC